MANVSVHDSKKKWKAHYREDSWVDLLVRRHGILVHNHLEVLGELIRLKLSRRIELRRIDLFNLKVVVPR